MAADMAIEVADKNVTVLSLWVGAVKTELINKLGAVSFANKRK
jgi:NAD(P)-dependent dehydrogenase (short-subunit alcohol dehydrogenase family)